MLKNKEVNGKSTKNLTEIEDFYDDDFEDFDFGDEIENIGKLTTPSMSVTSTAVSVSPETDSAGNDLNSKSSNFADYELMSSLESEYNYEDNACRQNYDFRLFHEALEEVSISKQKRFKNGTRSSLTFSNEKVREIERDNQNLLTKIMKSGPSGDGLHNNKLNGKKKRPTIKSSAEVNRKKMQQKIDYENELLKRKLDKIAVRRPLSNTSA